MSHAKLILVGAVLGLALAFGLAYTNASDYLGHRAHGTAATVTTGHTGGHCQMHGDAQLPIAGDGVDHAAAFNALLNNLDTATPPATADGADDATPGLAPTEPPPAKVTVPTGNPPEDYTTPTAECADENAACGGCFPHRAATPATAVPASPTPAPAPATPTP